MVKTSLVEAYDDRDVIAQIQKLDKTVKDQKDIAQGAVTAAQEARDAARDTSDKFAESVGAVVDQARMDMAQSRADVAEVRSIVAAETETVERLRLQTIALQGTVNSTRDEVQRQAGVVEQTNRNAVVKSGTEIPQVISGSGGLQVAGDVSVGGDLTVAESGHIHMDASDIEVAGMAIEKSGRTTVMSNEGGISFAEDTPVSFLGRIMKLGSDSVGSTNKPIYIKDGVPTVTTNVARTDAVNFFTGRQVIPTVRGGAYGGQRDGGVSLTSEGLNGYHALRSLTVDGTIVYTEKIIGDASGITSVMDVFRSDDGSDYYIQKYFRAGNVLYPYFNRSYPADAPSGVLVTKGFVSATNPETRQNNLLHMEGNESAAGHKAFTDSVIGRMHSFGRQATTSSLLPLGSFRCRHGEITIKALIAERYGMGLVWLEITLNGTVVSNVRVVDESLSVWKLSHGRGMRFGAFTTVDDAGDVWVTPTMRITDVNNVSGGNVILADDGNYATVADYSNALSAISQPAGYVEEVVQQ